MQSSGKPDDMEPHFARRSTLLRSPKLCPRCLAPLSARGKLGGWLVPQDYYCEACGYSGTVFVESTSPLNESGKDEG